MVSAPLAVLGILQARVSSSRLPGKVLKPILGQPMLALQLERLLRSSQIEQLVVATSTESSDDAIEMLCHRAGIACARGSLNDVLDRFYFAAVPFRPQHIVRLTGDCPLADPELIDQVIATHLRGNYDYTSNCLSPSYPDGLDVEVFRFRCLERAWTKAVLPSEREHVTPFIRDSRQKYRLHEVRSSTDLSKLRWTVDEAEDLQLIRAIFDALYPVNPEFGMRDILALLKQRPELCLLNTHFVRNAGLQKSLEDDRRLAREDTDNER